MILFNEYNSNLVDDIPVQEIVEHINRLYGIKFLYYDPQTKELKINDYQKEEHRLPDDSMDYSE
jgi:hypothetical protein